jgi:hypothetical protein
VCNGTRKALCRQLPFLILALRFPLRQKSHFKAFGKFTPKFAFLGVLGIERPNIFLFCNFFAPGFQK